MEFRAMIMVLDEAPGCNFEGLPFMCLAKVFLPYPEAVNRRSNCWGFQYGRGKSNVYNAWNNIDNYHLYPN